MSGVAGDFFLVTAGPGDTTVVVVGDMSGKGLAAAKCAAFVRTSLATFASYTYSPSRLLELANRALVERGHDFEMLVTAACAVVDTAAQTVTWSLAGQSRAGWARHGNRGAPAAGAAAGARGADRPREAVGPLPPGDGFVLFTDGTLTGDLCIVAFRAQPGD